MYTSHQIHLSPHPPAPMRPPDAERTRRNRRRTVNRLKFAPLSTVDGEKNREIKITGRPEWEAQSASLRSASLLGLSVVFSNGYDTSGPIWASPKAGPYSCFGGEYLWIHRITMMQPWDHLLNQGITWPLDY